jgi:hypothetical protein
MTRINRGTQMMMIRKSPNFQLKSKNLFQNGLNEVVVELWGPFMITGFWIPQGQKDSSGYTLWSLPSSAGFIYLNGNFEMVIDESDDMGNPKLSQLF